MANDGNSEPKTLFGHSGGALHLTAADPRSMMQVGVWPDSAAAVQARIAALAGLDTPLGPGRFVMKDGMICVRTGFDSYLLIDVESEDATVDLPADLCTMTDLSHSRRGIAIEGPATAAFLNRDIAVDLAQDACPAGSALQTAMHHVPILLLRHAENRFALYVYRSYAEDLMDWLTDMARPFAD